MKKIFLFDTETVGLQPRNFIYDIGWIITDRHGNEYKRRNFIVRDVITDPSKMMSAFYAKKVFSYYIPAIEAGKIRVISMDALFQIMYEDLTECETIAAYNIGFDLAALYNTIDVIGLSDQFIFDDFNKLCIWNFACKALLNSDNYRNVARANGWLSRPAGNYKSGAEFAYRYISGKHDFIESHTALDDCDIEKEIMVKAFSTKTKIPYDQYNNNPWMGIQPKGFLSRHRWGKQAELFGCEV